MINIRILVLLLFVGSSLPLLSQSSVPPFSEPQPSVIRDGFTLRQEHDSLYWLNDWRLPYPVYRFDTGDVDGDGSVDALVGVIKSTRYFPEKGRRLFIFKMVNGKARPLWMGSKLGGILQDFRFVDGKVRSLETTADTPNNDHTVAEPSRPHSLYVVAEYRWAGFGMTFVRFIVKNADEATALAAFNND